MNTTPSSKRTAKKRLFRPRDHDLSFYERWRWTIQLGAYGFLAFQIFGTGAACAGFDKLARIMRILSLLMPLFGAIFHDQVDRIMNAIFGRIFWPEGRETGPAHSEGEALYQRGDFAGAVDWFKAAVTADPADWRAQRRIAEIVLERFDDRLRVAEERSRLLHTPGVPEAVWVDTALDLGRDWVALGHPDRAVNVYKGLLWKLPEGVDADEARRRLKDLGAWSDPAAGPATAAKTTTGSTEE